MALSKVGKNQVDQSASLTVDSDLTVDTNTLYVDSTNNRVGVGTSSPATALDVTGAITTDGLTSEAANGTITSKASGSSFCSFTANTSAGNNAYVFFQQAGTEMSRITAFNGDALAFSTGSGATERLQIDSSGRVTMSSQPSFRASDAPSPSTNTPYTNFGALYHNAGNHFNITNGRFTAPVAGRYLFVLTVGNNSTFGVDLRLNAGSTICRIEFINPPGFSWQTGAVIIQLSANDFVDAYVFTGTAAMSPGTGNFSGHLLG